MRLSIVIGFRKGFAPFFMFPFLSLVLVTSLTQSVLELNGRPLVQNEYKISKTSSLLPH